MIRTVLSASLLRLLVNQAAKNKKLTAQTCNLFWAREENALLQQKSVATEYKPNQKKMLFRQSESMKPFRRAKMESCIKSIKLSMWIQQSSIQTR